MSNASFSKHIRQRRKILTNKERANFALMASLYLPKLLPHLPKNANVGLYLDDFGELPTAPILTFCQKHDFVPFFTNNNQRQTPTLCSCFYAIV